MNSHIFNIQWRKEGHDVKLEGKGAQLLIGREKEKVSLAYLITLVTWKRVVIVIDCPQNIPVVATNRLSRRYQSRGGLS